MPAPVVPWWTYLLMAVWFLVGVSVVFGAIALWRIGTFLRRLVWHIEHPSPAALASLQATQAAMSAARAQPPQP